MISTRVAAKEVDFAVKVSGLQGQEDGKGMMLVGDSFQLCQCLVNLCDNAIKFARKTGGEAHMRVSLQRSSSDWAVVQVDAVAACHICAVQHRAVWVEQQELVYLTSYRVSPLPYLDVRFSLPPELRAGGALLPGLLCLLPLGTWRAEAAQVSSHYSREHGGTGLGLAITQKVVTGMGGTITCSSDGLGKGSTF
eukprot:749384-Hanusia_phi.AAC.3